MSFIKPFVSFGYKAPERCNRSNKIKITRHYNFLFRERQNYVAVKPPRGSNFEKVQSDINPTFKRIPKRIKKTAFKVLFIPNAEKNARIKYSRKNKKYGLEKTGAAGTSMETIIPFDDADALAVDPKSYVESLVKKFHPLTLFRLYNPQDWHDEAFSRDGIANAVNMFFMTMYGDALKSVEKGDAWGLIVEERKTLEGGKIGKKKQSKGSLRHRR